MDKYLEKKYDKKTHGVDGRNITYSKHAQFIESSVNHILKICVLYIYPYIYTVLFNRNSPPEIKNHP